MNAPTKLFLNITPDPDILALLAEDSAPEPITLTFNLISISGFGSQNVESSTLWYKCESPEVLNFIEALAPSPNTTALQVLEYKFIKSTTAKKLHALVAERVKAQFPTIKIQPKIEGNLRSQPHDSHS